MTIKENIPRDIEYEHTIIMVSGGIGCWCKECELNHSIEAINRAKEDGSYVPADKGRIRRGTPPDHIPGFHRNKSD